jgi:hypothetical protein
MVPSCGGGDRSSGAPTQALPAERFVAVEGDVVSDSATGLEWTGRDEDQALPWDRAERHCRELVLEGRNDWRLPEITELQGIYDKRLAEPCGDRTCRLDPRIHIRSPYVWSGTERFPGTRFYLDFSLGTSLSPWISPKLVRRVLCVRTRAP